MEKLEKVYLYFLSVFNRKKFLEKIGLNLKGKLFLYGNPWGMFGTEPWIITIGDNVHITKEVIFITHDGGTLVFRDQVPDLEITKPITVGNNVYIGTRTIILPGVNIGDNVVIGAGSVVTKDIASGVVAAGVPAIPIKSSKEYFEKLKKESLKVGHLKAKEKENELKKIYGYK